MIGTIVTAGALIVGGAWAYFKLVKGRTYRPRLGVRLDGEWLTIGGRKLLHVRITVRNIGASQVTLRQRGTGLRIGTLTDQQPPPPASQTWREGRVYQVLANHAWIEPDESVSDELLIDLGVPDALPTLLWIRLVWQRPGDNNNVVVHARRILPANSTMQPDTAPAPTGV